MDLMEGRIIWRKKLIFRYSYPTSPFTILEPRNPWMDEFHVFQERLATDFKAPQLGKGSSGSYMIEFDIRHFFFSMENS